VVSLLAPARRVRQARPLAAAVPATAEVLAARVALRVPRAPWQAARRGLLAAPVLRARPVLRVRVEQQVQQARAVRAASA
jgi:hypothetical protein